MVGKVLVVQFICHKIAAYDGMDIVASEHNALRKYHKLIVEKTDFLEFEEDGNAYKVIFFSY